MFTMINEYCCRNQQCGKFSVKLSLPLENIGCPKCSKNLGVSDDSGNIYFLKKYIGGGGYGIVYKACKIENLREAKDYYAIKFIRDKHSRETCNKMLIREIENLKNAKKAGAKVPQYIEFYCPDNAANNSLDDNYFCVQEFVEGSDLQSIFANMTVGNTCDFNEEKIFKYLIDLLRTICLLQSQSIIHRDIKPSNIILKEEGKSQKLYLIDFGSSKDLTMNGQTTNNAITTAYSPPESIPGNEQLNLTENKLTIDPYSLAIAMFYLLTGENHNIGRKERGHESWDNWMIKVRDKAHDLFPFLERMSKFHSSERYETAMEALIAVSVKAFDLYEDRDDRDGYLLEGWLLKIASDKFEGKKSTSYNKFLGKSKAKEKEKNRAIIVQMIKESEEN
jgi:serine/threonine protein kinase